MMSICLLWMWKVRSMIYPDFFALRSGAMVSDSVYRYLPMTQEEVNSIADLLGRLSDRYDCIYRNSGY